MPESNVSQAGYDTKRVQWVHLLGWNWWMARGRRVSRKKGRREGRKEERKKEGLSGFIFAAVFISLRSCHRPSSSPSSSSRFPTSSHTRIESVNFSTTDFTLRRTRNKARNAMRHQFSFFPSLKSSNLSFIYIIYYLLISKYIYILFEDYYLK